MTVYGRSHYIPKSLSRYRGVALVVLPTLECKYTDTVIHTGLSLVHALFRRFDVILICNAANSVYAAIPRLCGIPVVVNVDGIERMRQKWSWAGKAYYRISEYLSTLFPSAIVTDARVIQRYYREQYGHDSVFIPYGALTDRPSTRHTLEELKLAPQEYILYVSRLEPENNAHLVVRAFENVHTSKRLVVVGDAPYSQDYIREVKQTHDPRILFPGAIYGLGYRELQANAFCYLHATQVGGTHPALIEAMGQGNIVVANGTPENIEVLGGAGVLYDKNDAGDLARKLQDIIHYPEKYAHLKQAALARARSEYSWDAVVTQYEQLFARLVG